MRQNVKFYSLKRVFERMHPHFTHIQPLLGFFYLFLPHLNYMNLFFTLKFYNYD